MDKRERDFVERQRQRQLVAEKQRAQSERWKDSRFEESLKLNSITSTSTNMPKYAKYNGTGSFGTFDWGPMTVSDSTADLHSECTPTDDYNDVRKVLIALLVRDHGGVTEFPQEMIADIENWKVVVDDNERSLRIIAIPPEVHIAEDKPDDDISF